MLWIGAALVLSACGQDQRTAGSDGPPPQLRDIESDDEYEDFFVPTRGDEIDPEDVTVALLDQSFLAYVACMEPETDGWARVNPRRFVGTPRFYGLADGVDDFDRLERIEADCAFESRYEEFAGAYGLVNVVTAEQIDEIQDDVTLCLRNISSPFEDEWQALEFAGGVNELSESLSSFQFDLDETAIEGLFNCALTAIHGPIVEF